MTLSVSLVDVTQKIVDLLVANEVTLGISVVYYGDQARIAKTPAVCVESIVKQNNLRQAAAARMIDPIIETAILVYHSEIQSTQANRKQADQFGEAVELFLNQHRDLGGLVIHSYITEMQSGYAQKGNSVFRACRLTHHARTQGLLPS